MASKRRKTETVKTTRLDAEELRLFVKVRRYVRGMSGPVSDAEVLRFLIRDWEPK
jgi:hypothetical protein